MHRGGRSARQSKVRSGRRARPWRSSSRLDTTCIRPQSSNQCHCSMSPAGKENASGSANPRDSSGLARRAQGSRRPRKSTVPASASTRLGLCWAGTCQVRREWGPLCPPGTCAQRDMGRLEGSDRRWQRREGSSSRRRKVLMARTDQNQGSSGRRYMADSWSRLRCPLPQSTSQVGKEREPTCLQRRSGPGGTGSGWRLTPRRRRNIRPYTGPWARRDLLGRSSDLRCTVWGQMSPRRNSYLLGKGH